MKPHLDKFFKKIICMDITKDSAIGKFQISIIYEIVIIILIMISIIRVLQYETYTIKKIRSEYILN